MTENLRALFIYVGCAHPHVSEVLDFPLYTDFKSNATESLSHIVLDDIRTDNTFGMEEHVEVNDAGYLRVDSRVKEDLGFSDFFGITDIRPQDGYPVLENVETVGEFASLFRADYDRMKPEGMDINTFLEGYLTYGEYEHTGYHPVRDFLSGLADVTIIIPVIDAILGKDIITGETLNDFERGMKAAGAAIDLFTLGQAMVLAGGVEAGAGIIVKTLAVEMVSNAAGYSAGYAANEMGMPLPVTWILSVATGCTVSATVGGYLFTSADGTITKCTAEEAGDLIKRLDKTDSPTSFADMMSPEDATRYLRFLENGSTEGLTSAELEGIKKVDELLALKKISYQDVLDIRNSGKALESGSTSNVFKAPEITTNSKGELTNGTYTLNQQDMLIHVDGKNPNKSQFLYDVDANKAVLDASAYADANNLWEASSGNLTDFANKAKVPVTNGYVGVTGKGELTSYINVYRTKTGYIHGCPGNP